MSKESKGRSWALGDWPLWAAVTALGYLSRSKRARRAALRGAVSGGIATLISSLLGHARLLGGRAPSIGAGLAGAFAVAADLELRAAGLPIEALAAGWTAARVREGRARLDTSVLGASLGASVALASTRVWPVPPADGSHAPAVSLPSHAEPAADGAGLSIVVNSNSGNGDSPTQVLKEALPQAEVVEVEVNGGDELRKALDERADGSRSLGVAGGDGSVNTAAQVALDEGKPLMVVPAGTFNHLTGALGIESIGDAVDAVKEGQAVEMDVATIDGKVFLNTASLGGYVEFVDARQKLERRIGKWPAVVVALVRMLRSYEPLRVQIDGKEACVWMAFIGNCRYHPSGFAPSWRERLDDGLIDFRYVDGSAPFARSRLILAVLTGRLGRSRVYRQSVVERLTIRSSNGRPLRMARDGETFDASEEVVIEKLPDRLAVYVPLEEPA